MCALFIDKGDFKIAVKWHNRYGLPHFKICLDSALIRARAARIPAFDAFLPADGIRAAYLCANGDLGNSPLFIQPSNASIAFAVR